MTTPNETTPTPRTLRKRPASKAAPATTKVTVTIKMLSISATGGPEVMKAATDLLGNLLGAVLGGSTETSGKG